ncbi:hypothetical protein HY490_02460 [Candidatus Woesearchaeota archaeon]|nr:hypothetical protein [Candidatus Woesearchaeota archaeon]
MPPNKDELTKTVREFYTHYRVLSFANAVNIWWCISYSTGRFAYELLANDRADFDQFMHMSMGVATALGGHYLIRHCESMLNKAQSLLEQAVHTPESLP